MNESKDKIIKDLKNKYNKKIDEYLFSLNPYDYNNIVWKDINDKVLIIKERIEVLEIDNEKYYIELFNELINYIKRAQSLKSDLLTSKEVFIKNISKITTTIKNDFLIIWNKIKFVFAIPACVFASFVFTYFLSLLYNNIFSFIFPNAYNDDFFGVIDAIVCLIIYCLIRFNIFKDVYLNNIKINFKSYIIKHSICILIWWLLFYIIRYREVYAVADLNEFEWALFLPYFPISAFNHEFFITPIITYFIVNILLICSILLYVYFMEKRYNKLNKSYNEYKYNEDDARKYYNTINKNKNNKKMNNNLNGRIIDEDYDYYFDINKDYTVKVKEKIKFKDKIKKIFKRKKKNDEKNI